MPAFCFWCARLLKKNDGKGEFYCKRRGRWKVCRRGRAIRAAHAGMALGMNSVDRTGINTGAAIDAGSGVDAPLVSSFADGVNWAGFVTCAAVDAFFGNLVCHGVTPFLFVVELRHFFIIVKLPYICEKVQRKGEPGFAVLMSRKFLNSAWC